MKTVNATIVIIAITSIFSLGGCASREYYEAMAQENDALSAAMNGTGKWSEYYEIVYLIAETRNNQTKMYIADKMIDTSYKLEKGKISKHEFDSIRRKVNIEANQKAQMARSQNAAADAVAAANNAANAAAWQQIGATMQNALAPKIAPVPSNSMRCRTYRSGASVYTDCN